jgi:hypothetical protein
MGKEEFKLMKGNSIFVNIGRGDTVVQSSLLEALEARLGEGEMESDIGTLRIGGASLEYVSLIISYILFLLFKTRC